MVLAHPGRETDVPDLLSLLRTYSGVLSDSECDAVLREHAALEHAGQASYESSLHAITGKQTQSTFKAVSLSPGTAAFDIVHRCTQQVIQRWVRELQAERKFNITALNVDWVCFPVMAWRDDS